MSLDLEENAEKPLYKIVSEALTEKIRSGRLKPGEQLPSTRELAEMLSISRQTAVKCYKHLQDLGLVQTKVGMGTVVSPNLLVEGKSARRSAKAEQPARLEFVSEYARNLENEDTSPLPLAEHHKLNFGLLPPELLPVKIWQRCVSSQYAAATDYLQSTGDIFGAEILRKELCAYLRRARGLTCEPEQVIVCGSSDLALSLVSKVLVDQGDTVAVENPGFKAARIAFSARGAQIEPVEVDDEGIQASALRELSNKPKAVYVTPCHHDPSGAVMSNKRRRALLVWAHEADAIIVEDDFDSELFYGASIPPALQPSAPDRIIYINTFWKMLFPLSSLAFIVVPPNMVAMFRKVKSIEERHFSVVDQLALAQFVSEGHLSATIRKARSIYQQRRQELIFEITALFGGRIHVSRFSSGTNLLVRFPESADAEQILSAGEQAELPIVSTRSRYCHNPRPNEYLIAFNCLAGNEMAQRLKRFHDLLHI